MTVKNIMTKNPVFLDSSNTIKQAIETLYELDIRHLPVVEKGEVIGMVSDRDLREISLSASEVLSDNTKISKRLDAPVSTIMHRDVLFVNPEMELLDVIDLFIEQKIGALPVVDPGTGKLVGIVSYIDILEWARDAA